MGKPKDIYDLYEIVSKFSKENPETPIMFLTTDKIKVAHLITDHGMDIFTMIQSVGKKQLEFFLNALNVKLKEAQN